MIRWQRRMGQVEADGVCDRICRPRPSVTEIERLRTEVRDAASQYASYGFTQVVTTATRGAHYTSGVPPVFRTPDHLRRWARKDGVCAEDPTRVPGGVPS